ncbi:MAG: hypothetical protein H8F28_05775 [Fibrella sp.]|nr:hypothetical protein [Armatimonadota bacterium]
MKIYLVVTCVIAGNLFLQTSSNAQTPTKKPVSELPQVIWTTLGETNRLANARREARDKTPEGRRAAERYAMIKQAGELVINNQFLEARKLFNTVLAEAPNEPVSSHAIEGLGEIARRMGDNASALRYYRDSISVKPGQTWITGRSNDSVVRLKYALLLRNAGLYDEAWESYQIAMKNRTGWVLPQPPNVTRRDVPTAQFVFVASLSLAERLHGNDTAQAFAFARDAVRANPLSGLPHYYLGALLYKQDEFESKVEFEKAMKYGHGDYTERAKDYLHYWEMTGGPKPKKAAPTVTEVTPEPKQTE